MMANATDDMPPPAPLRIRDKNANVAASARLRDTRHYGLTVLALTEAWERFSFYGMQALLVLYLANDLLRPEHAERVVGLASFRSLVEAVFGHMSTRAFASEVFGLYGAFAWFTPLLGGFLGDRLLGRRRTVMLGAAIMSAGHVLMAFDAPFLLALLLLVLGCGCLKGNISAQLGTLYEHDDAGRRRGYALFNVGVNCGGLLGPFACGALAAAKGWHAGFALAGGVMLIGLVTYAAGARFLPPDGGSAPASALPKVPRAERRRVLGLLLTLLLGLFFSISYYQLGDAYLLWIDADVDLRLLGHSVPVAWFASLDSIFTILASPLLITLWRLRPGHDSETADLGKIGIASAITAAACFALALVNLGGGRVAIWWPLLFSASLGTAFVYHWPITLALVARCAPSGMGSTMMGIAFLTLFISYNVVGWIGSLFDRMTPASFWTVNGAIAAAGAIFVAVARRPVVRLLAAAEV